MMKHTVDPVLTVDWTDEGCALWRACLTCPLPVCVEELPAGVASLRGQVRHEAARRLFSEGASVKQIASVFGVSSRRAYSILGGVRETRRAG